MRSVDNTVLGRAIAQTAPGTVSAPLSVPTLGQLVPRKDPFNRTGSDYPDAAGDAVTHGYGGKNGARGWIWFGKACWDEPRRRIVFIASPHPADVMGPSGPPPPQAGSFNPYLTLLTVYDEDRNSIAVMEAPFTADVSRTKNHWPRGVQHGFDNQCVVPTTGELLKAVPPHWFDQSGQGAAEYLGLGIGRFDLKALVPGDVTSGREGAAYVGTFPIPNRTPDGRPRSEVTAGAMDYMPLIDKVFHGHKDRFWIIDPVRGAHTPNHADGQNLGFTLPNPAEAERFPIHNVGHYQHTVNKIIYGGGALAPAFFSREFVAIDGRTLEVTRLDDAPATFSMSETNLSAPIPKAFREAKSCQCGDPGSGESVFFQDTGPGGTKIYALDTRRPRGHQWRLLHLTLAHEVDWVCPIPPPYAVIVLGTSAPNGAATMRVYRHARIPDVTPPSVPRNVRAVATSSTTATITCDASIDPVIPEQPTSGVASYRFYRDGQLRASSSTPSFVDAGLSSATHNYTVAAVDAAGNVSAQSAASVLTTA